MTTSHKSLLDMTLSTIAALDSVLGLQRSLLLDAKDDVERAKVRAQINGVLDERLTFMKQRDELLADK